VEKSAAVSQSKILPLGKNSNQHSAKPGKTLPLITQMIAPSNASWPAGGSKELDSFVAFPALNGSVALLRDGSARAGLLSAVPRLRDWSVAGSSQLSTGLEGWPITPI
jgi:hypothetical protein